MALSPGASALRVTNRVCGIGPSTASTSSSTPSTIDSTRSTSPPKSACPGVSTMLMRVPPYSMAQFLARMVMPRSRSMSSESMTRSPTFSCAAKVPDCFRRQSTRVVLPWSTCAMIAILRMGRFISQGTKKGAQGSRFALRLRRRPPGRLWDGLADADGGGCDAHLDEEGEERDGQGQHGADEKNGDQRRQVDRQERIGEERHNDER